MQIRFLDKKLKTEIIVLEPMKMVIIKLIFFFIF